MSLKVRFTNIPQYHECEKCRELFKSALQLKYHRFRIHNHRRPYVCRLCKKSFRRINDLQEHRRTHNDERFNCTVCDTACSSRRLLTRHEGSHIHFEGNHECGYCSASFLNLAEARLHVLLVHGDTTVLPPPRPRLVQQSQRNDVKDEVFTARSGEGLKIKLKRKLSADGSDEHQAGSDDFNPGSQATIDSGKGNSDMDDEEVLRNSNQLLKMATFMPQTEPKPLSTIEQHNTNSLLMRPKLEVTHGLFKSKIQPRLDSSDFLSKTNFASAKPPGQSSSAFGSSNGLSAQKSFFGNSLFGGGPAFGGQMTAPYNTKPSFVMPPAPFNGNILKGPSASLFQNSRFGSSSSAFGAPLSKRNATSGFSGLQNGLTNNFKFSNTGKNGMVSDAIFGSREKVQQTIASDLEGKQNAFEQYAQPDGASSTSNIFAEAMRQAKNPPKRHDSDSFSDESISSSEEESDDSGVSASSQSSGEDDAKVTPTQQSPSHPEIEDNMPIILSPPQKLPPVLEESSVHINSSPKSQSAAKNKPPIGSPLTRRPSTSSPVKQLPSASPNHVQPSTKKKSPRAMKSPSKTPSHTPEHVQDKIKSPVKSPMTNGLSPGITNGYEVHRQRHVSAKTTKSSQNKKPSPQMVNGDAQQEQNIAYNIDLERPEMSISIPKLLINQSCSRTKQKSTVSRRPSVRTPMTSPSSQESVFSPPHHPPKFYAPKKPVNMAPIRKKPRIGPRSYMQQIKGDQYQSDNEDQSTEISTDKNQMFYRDEIKEHLSNGRTNCHAPYLSRYRENQRYLCYLRLRALDLILTLFPNIRVGGDFCKETDDVESLLDNIMDVIQSKTTSKRCIPSMASKRKKVKVVVCRATKHTVRNLQRKLCRLVRMAFPAITLDGLEQSGTSTLPKLIHKIIKENSP